MKMILLFVVIGIVAGQERHHAPISDPASSHEKDAEEGPSAFEAEFVASDIFRSGSYIQPLWRRLAFEGHYFGGTSTDVGVTGASWTFRLRELKLAPGFGVLFGSNEFTTSPALTFRWDYERKWLVTQGLIVQGFRKTPVFSEAEEGEPPSSAHEPVAFVRPTIADGNHLSGRWKRLTVGGTWEHIHFREGTEWKGGGRVAVRLFPRVSALVYVLGPGRVEWRGGILIHQLERD